MSPMLHTAASVSEQQARGEAEAVAPQLPEMAAESHSKI